ncbi:MAG TPA: hypothetical protein DCR45_04005 [Gammaproteobacteria bacterium]|nr:hypothetical protein [Gammaproteobacteria bacterium]HBP99390.1 hypothetical protein [Gammaproteobacteria bacterium]HCA37144.1 hypothetical protein [Gammaproteobacteria bacterium]
MKKIVWTAFGTSFVLVNVIAEVGAYYTGIYIHMFFRIALIVGVTLGATVLGGTFKLIDVLDQEKPLAGTVKDTLGADRKKT